MKKFKLTREQKLREFKDLENWRNRPHKNDKKNIKIKKYYEDKVIPYYDELVEEEE